MHVVRRLQQIEYVCLDNIIVCLWDVRGIRFEWLRLCIGSRDVLRHLLSKEQIWRLQKMSWRLLRLCQMRGKEFPPWRELMFGMFLKSLWLCRLFQSTFCILCRWITRRKGFIKFRNKPSSQWKQRCRGHLNRMDVDCLLAAESYISGAAVKKSGIPHPIAGAGSFAASSLELVKLQGSITEPLHSPTWKTRSKSRRQFAREYICKLLEVH